MTLSLGGSGESVKISVWLLVTVCLQKTLLCFSSAHMNCEKSKNKNNLGEKKYTVALVHLNLDRFLSIHIQLQHDAACHQQMSRNMLYCMFIR